MVVSSNHHIFCYIWCVVSPNRRLSFGTIHLCYILKLLISIESSKIKDKRNNYLCMIHTYLILSNTPLAWMIQPWSTCTRHQSIRKKYQKWMQFYVHILTWITVIISWFKDTIFHTVSCIEGHGNIAGKQWNYVRIYAFRK